MIGREHGVPWPALPTMSGDAAPPAEPPPSAAEATVSTAPGPADSPPGGTAAAKYDQGTHQAVVPGAMLPGDSTAASPIDRLEVACLAMEHDGRGWKVHAFGYDTERRPWTVCGLDASAMELLVGGLPSCELCSLGRATLVPPWSGITQ